MKKSNKRETASEEYLTNRCSTQTKSSSLTDSNCRWRCDESFKKLQQY